MLNQELIEILKCPVCVKHQTGTLRLFKSAFLICSNCNRKYPIFEDIPVMLIEEGNKWLDVKESDLPLTTKFSQSE